MSRHGAAIMAAPCGKCPFRKDVPIYLRRDRRAEIAESLLSGGSFHCHQTTEYWEDEDGFGDMRSTSDSMLCAGAEKALLGIGQSSQMGRIAERLGMADLDKTAANGAPSWDLREWQELAEGATADNPEREYVECCSYVGPYCTAPAGFLVGGGVVEGTVAATERCSMCGEPLCEECVTESGMCPYCAEDGDEVDT